MRLKLGIASLAVLLATLTACGGSSGGPSGDGGGGTLVISIAGDPKVFNTNYTFDNYAYYTDRNVYSRLVGYDYATGELFGDLATEWKNSEDNLEFTFTLRSGVKWHDGEDFSSADVVWTYNDVIRAAAEAYSFNAVRNVEMVEAPDATTVVFTLKEPDANFPRTIADYYGPIVLAKHLYDGQGDPKTNPANLKPVGTGPFRFVSMTAGDRVVMERNDDYYGTKAGYQNLVFRVIPNRATAVTALKAGELGYVTASPAFGEVESLRQYQGIKVDTTESNIIQWIGFNLEHEPLDDPKVRQAIGHAIDVNEINDKAYFGLAAPATGTYLSYSPVFDATATQPEFDIDTANKMLDEAGLPMGADGIRFELQFVAFNASIYGGPEAAQVVREQLKKVGIDATIDLIDVAVLNQQVFTDGKFDLVTIAGLHGPNPQQFTNLIGTGGSLNAMDYSNPAVDEAFAMARQTADLEEQRKQFAIIQQQLATDLPRFNMVEYKYLRPHSDKLSGFWWQEGSGAKGISHDMYNGVTGVG